MHLPWLDCEGTHLDASSSILKSSVFQVLFQFFKNDLAKSSCLHEILHSTTFQFDYERVYNEYQSLAKRGIFLYLNQSSMMQCNFGGNHVFFRQKLDFFLKKCEIVVEGFLKVFGFGFWLEIILINETCENFELISENLWRIRADGRSRNQVSNSAMAKY